MNDTQEQEQQDAALVAALALAVETASAAVDALRALAQHPQPVRGRGWYAGWDAVGEAERQARQVLDRALAAEALIRRALKTEPIQVAKVH